MSAVRDAVGHVPNIARVAWVGGTRPTRNPRFVRALEAKVRKHGLPWAHD